ncbi:MAG: phage tail tape measure protein, partial [Paludibacteraceae bacterium]|nr:phage tail tape measure protein [Paludibacteraceae bacterium]
MTKETLESAGATEKLAAEMDAQETVLKNLRKGYADFVLEGKEGTDEARQLADRISELSGDLNENEKRLKAAENAADKFGEELRETKEDSEEAGEGFTVLKGVLANLVTKGLELAADAVRNLYSAYQEYDAGADAVIMATGATGEALEGLEKAYNSVTKSVVGDYTEIGSALGEVNTRFGFTDEQLEESTIQFVKFAEITGTDAVGAVQLVSRAMGDAGIDASEYSSLLDSLAVAAQASGISVDTLAENLTKYGAPMRSLGFDTQEAIAIFAQWEKAGVNTEIAFSGMKKAISNWAKAGKDPREEFEKTLKLIADCPDIASASQKAIEIFGAKAGPDLADAIQNGRFEYSQFLELLENSSGAVTNTYEATQDGMDKITLAIQGAKADAGAALAGFFDDHKEEFIAGIEALSSMIIGVIDNLPTIAVALGGITASMIAFKVAALSAKLATEGFTIATKAQAIAQKLLNAVMHANPIGLIILGITALVTAFMYLWKHCEGFRNFWIGMWDKIKAVVSVAVDWIKGCWEKIKAFFTGDSPIAKYFQMAWENIKIVWDVVVSYFKMIWENIKLVFSAVKSVLSGDFSGAWDAIKQVFANVKTFFTEKVWGAIKGVFANVGNWFSSTFSGAWTAIKNAFSAGIGWIKENWKTLLLFLTNPIAGIFKYCYDHFEGFRNMVDGVVSSVKNFFTGMWDGLKNGAVAAWEGVKTTFSTVASFFGNIFSTAWAKVKAVFSAGGQVFAGIKDGIVSSFKAVVNAIIGGINKVVAIPFRGLNSVLDQIAGVSIAGLQPFSFITWRAPVPQIPFLAAGGFTDGVS